MLSETEIRQRLIRLGNLERLYAKARERIALLEAENKHLKERIKELEKRDGDKNTKIEALAFQLEQIQNRVFGKKPTLLRVMQKRERMERDISSYCRPVPTHVTETRRHPVRACTHCARVLTNRTVKTFYEEDIPLPIETQIVKHEVEVGYCNACKRQSSGYPIPSKKTVLGAQVKKYICLLSIGSRLSHSQIKDHLKDVFSLSVSLGEVGNILKGEADTLRPAYERLKRAVTNQAAVHYDETGWKVAKEEQGRFAWVAAGTENNDAVFSLGKSRGKGNIGELGTAPVGISDDYGAYKNAFPEHQLCWAHPQRKLRDAAESNEIPEEKKKQCAEIYQCFSSLYRRIRDAAGTAVSSYRGQRWRNEFDTLAAPHARDPSPLVRLKESLRKNKEKYFTFLRHPGIPVDNNKAERCLRHLVLKRKISFGSKTQKGAETTSILASIILSLKWNDPENWFRRYLLLRS